MAPRWIVRLLSRVVPEERQDDVIGDLEELHGRRLSRWGRPLAWMLTVSEGLVAVVSHLVLGSMRAAARSEWGISWIELRLALRLLVQQPLVTLTSVVALAVGVGMAAGGFSLFRQGLYSDLPFPNGDRWTVVETYGERDGQRVRLDLERLRAFRASASAIDYIAGWESTDLNVVHQSGEVERIRGARVTPGTFAHLPYVPMAGRLLTLADGRPGAVPVTLIRESLWERRFSRAPDVLSRAMDIAGEPHLVVGVLPNGARFPAEGEIWLPLDEESMGAADDRSPLAGSRQVAILADGASLAEAETQLNRLSGRISRPGSGVEAVRHRVTLVTRTLASPQAQVAALAMMAVLFAVLLLIAANVANLIMARTSRRLPELAVRSALGASRRRLVGQLFVEALAIGVIASAPGLAIAGGILALYDRALDELPFWIDLGLDPATAVAVVVLVILMSAVIGVVPALRATGRSRAGVMRGSGRGGPMGVGRLGGAMIMAQVALSVALLGIALLYAEGFRAYVNPAFDLPDDRVLTARLVMDVSEEDLVEGGAESVGDSIMTVAREVRAALARVPAVAAVGYTSHLPRHSPYPEPVALEGREEVVLTPLVRQGPGVFEVLGVEPLQGRLIEERDLEPGAPPVVVVNEAFAVANFGTMQVLGRRLRTVDPEHEAALPEWREIVGVVPDVMEVTGSAGAAGIYHPFEPVRFLSVALRVASNPMGLAGTLRRTLFDLDPGLNVTDVVPLEAVGSENRQALLAMSSALAGVGLITLLLSLAGVFSIVSLAVSQRTREIGVRVALGAEAGSILWSLVRRAALLVGVGGVLGAVVGHQIANARLFVFALPAAGPWLFASLVALLLVAGVAACWIPARRALGVQPVEALRSES